ncbi:hypothetical protein CEUSTIGMA_g1814.t1 [Chlamydomonas eustigma]|uniref:Uncharacterized protein n=1 Tax=Chlamydomonas eustigma TaxID=1157962 RepID=A0A250WU91_9CHLO|nr:hypothetical protein CEUSTIGMA_g1814.t1 [Chlamydomonas eustigma]|eukprot:GAX74365.1 hypothetical protein CEUSTIGMA_g1814.t1 [Chlamydomonas eustigma]
MIRCQSPLCVNAIHLPSFGHVAWRSACFGKTLEVIRLVAGVPNWAVRLQERFRYSATNSLSVAEGLQLLGEAAQLFIHQSGVTGVGFRDDEHSETTGGIQALKQQQHVLMSRLVHEQTSGCPEDLLHTCVSVAEEVLMVQSEVKELVEAVEYDLQTIRELDRNHPVPPAHNTYKSTPQPPQQQGSIATAHSQHAPPAAVNPALTHVQPSSASEPGKAGRQALHNTPPMHSAAASHIPHLDPSPDKHFQQQLAPSSTAAMTLPAVAATNRAHSRPPTQCEEGPHGTFTFPSFTSATAYTQHEPPAFSHSRLPISFQGKHHDCQPSSHPQVVVVRPRLLDTQLKVSELIRKHQEQQQLRQEHVKKKK